MNAEAVGAWLAIEPDTEIVIKIDPAPPPPLSGSEREAWQMLVGANSRHFNGPILAYESFQGGVIHARRERYARLAIRPTAGTGVTILSVTGVLTALDERGVVHALLGRRGAQTRVYPGRWELTPSGGIDPPPDHYALLGLDDVRRQLASEAREELGLELGLELDTSSARPIALQHDAEGHSVDLVMRLDTGRTLASFPRTPTWEVDSTRWVPLGAPVEDTWIPTTFAAWGNL